jgi:hypothetical protein
MGSARVRDFIHLLYILSFYHQYRKNILTYHIRLDAVRISLSSPFFFENIAQPFKYLSFTKLRMFETGIENILFVAFSSSLSNSSWVHHLLDVIDDYFSILFNYILFLKRSKRNHHSDV